MKHYAIMAIKKLSIIVCSIVVLACGCSSNNSSENTYTSESSVSNVTNKSEAYAYTTASHDISASAVETSEPEIAKKSFVNVIYEDSKVEETEDTDLAMNFSLDLTKSWLMEDSSLLDVDNYIENKYLNEYVRDNLNQTIRSESGALPQTYDIYAQVYDVEEVGGINYVNIYLKAYHNNRQYGLVGGCTVGVRDGKVVNVVREHSIQPIHYCIYETPYKAGDSIYKPNIWDDEMLAQRAVKAFKMYANEEYPYFQAAWDSLGE